MKKEDIYITLEGKSEGKLTDLYNFLKLLNYDIDSFDSFFANKYLHFNTNCNRWWTFSVWDNENKQEVTIQQLKEILQPMENKEEQLRKEAKERGFINGAKFYCLNKKELVLIDNNIRFFCPDDMYDEGNCGLHINGNYIFLNGKWGALIEETLEQQLEKAKAEVKRLEEEIEDSKIKIGDWVISELNDCVFRYQYGRVEYDLTKITDKELINKLNNLIK